MVKKIITFTNKQDKQQEIKNIKAKLILAEERLEKEGYSKRSVTDIMKDVLKRKGIYTK